MRPFRSMLYVPGSNARAMDKCASLPVDALILDLEDAVAPDAKADARDIVAAKLREAPFGSRYVLVRINALTTDWGADDVAAIASAGPDAILLPKVGAPSDLATLKAAMGPSGADIWAMIESPDAILNIRDIASFGAPLAGFVLGTNDLLKDLRAVAGENRANLGYALQAALTGARAAGLLCIDGVYNAFKDAEGLQAECRHGRDLGYDGKSLIHPAQVDIANQIFAPTEAEVTEAEAIVAAFDAALADGQAVGVLNGKIVENLHAETARRTLAMAAAVAQRELTT